MNKDKTLTPEEVEQAVVAVANGNASAFAHFIGYDPDTIYRAKNNGAKRNACLTFLVHNFNEAPDFWRARFEAWHRNKPKDVKE